MQSLSFWHPLKFLRFTQPDHKLFGLSNFHSYLSVGITIPWSLICTWGGGAWSERTLISLSKLSSLSEDRVGAHLEETADTWTILIGAGNAEVTLLTPVGSPGVSDDPEVFTVLRPIADEVHSMVHRGATSWGGNDAAFVLHENTWRGSNCDWQWLILECCNMRINVSACQGFITFHFENAIIFRSFAWALNCVVGVVISRDNLVWC